MPLVAEQHREGALAGHPVGGDVAQVVGDQDGAGQRADRRRAAYSARRRLPRLGLHVRRADHGDQPEEHEDHHLAERRCSRRASTRRCRTTPRPRTTTPTAQQPPGRGRGEHQAGHRRHGEGDRRRPQHQGGGNEPGGRQAHRPGPGGRRCRGGRPNSRWRSWCRPGGRGPRPAARAAAFHHDRPASAYAATPVPASTGATAAGRVRGRRHRARPSCEESSRGEDSSSRAGRLACAGSRCGRTAHAGPIRPRRATTMAAITSQPGVPHSIARNVKRAGRPDRSRAVPPTCGGALVLASRVAGRTAPRGRPQCAGGLEQLGAGDGDVAEPDQRDRQPRRAVSWVTSTTKQDSTKKPRADPGRAASDDATEFDAARRPATWSRTAMHGVGAEEPGQQHPRRVGLLRPARAGSRR